MNLRERQNSELSFGNIYDVKVCHVFFRILDIILHFLTGKIMFSFGTEVCSFLRQRALNNVNKNTFLCCKGELCGRKNWFSSKYLNFAVATTREIFEAVIVTGESEV